MPRGEILALLGPNGAGKTSTDRDPRGLPRPDRRRGLRARRRPAHAPRAWRDRLGIVLQESAPEPASPSASACELYAGYYPRRAHRRDASRSSGSRSRPRYATELSGGQRRRLDVRSRSSATRADLPRRADHRLRPRRAAPPWEVVDGLRALGKTILLTTHYMEEAERLADRIVVMARGEIVADGTPATLGGRDRAAAVDLLHAAARRRRAAGRRRTIAAASRCAPSSRWPSSRR